jgi:hypothetical protein
MTVKDTIASCLIIALGAILALHFALFWVYGGVFIHETNKVILTVETVMSVAIIGFGLERLASSARSNRPHRKTTPSGRSSRHQSIPVPASTLRASGPRAASAGYAATAVTAASSLLFSSDSSSADSRTRGIYDPIEGGSGVLVRLTQTEHEPTVDTGSTVSTPVLSH